MIRRNQHRGGSVTGAQAAPMCRLCGANFVHVYMRLDPKGMERLSRDGRVSGCKLSCKPGYPVVGRHTAKIARTR
jgi:hypothetical protein